MRTATTYLNRGLAFATVWLVLTAGDRSSWYLGGPAILCMAAWQIRDSPAADDSVRPWRLVRFVPFFLWSSLLGSWEVAWRALHWHLPISTGIQTYNLRLPPKSSARVFFANCISLFPGTLTVAWIGDELEVHFLVNCPASTASVRKLEMQVAYLFGHAIPAHNEEPTS